jgi:ribonuclease G
MSKELVISSNRHETKVAILEDDALVEIYFQRANEYGLAGSIHKGRVTRVLPGMQSAFVDLGLERDTFLYVSDFFEDNHEDLDKVHDEKPARAPRVEHSAPPPAAPVVTAPVADEEEAEGDEEPESVEAVPANGGTAAAAAAPGSQARPFRDRDRDRDRRDRRGRRGRRRGRPALPESKYATETPAETSEPETPAIAVEVPAAEPVFLLPGESLAKYRRAAQTASPAPAPVALPDVILPEVDFSSQEESGEEIIDAEIEEIEAPVAAGTPEPVAATPEFVTREPEAPMPEPEAPVEGATAARESEPAVETVVPEPPPIVTLEAVETISSDTGYVDASFAKLPPDVDPAELEEVDAIEEAREELLVDSEEDDDELDAAQEAAEEMIAAEDDPLAEYGRFITPEEMEAQSGGGEDGPEPARQPQSLTATLRDRERGARFQRGRRGRRRRGRGGEREDSPAARPEARVEPRPEVVAEERVVEQPVTPRPYRERSDRPAMPLITDLLKAGQEILVQIAKEPIGQKGARITSHIALPGRYCVYMPTVDHNGVSRKIASDEERLRLKKILQANRQGMTGGFIIRTAGEGRSEEEIANDMQFLFNLWLDIRTKSEKRAAPCLVHHDLDIVQRTLRDQVTSDFKTIWLDNDELYASTVQFVQRFQPALVSRVKLWTRQVPIFDAFNITNELEKALRPKVWLKSGGYIVINQTEALVAIDINTGKFVGKSNRLEDTIVRTNTEAVREIVRQVRLRDLGGIIVVDFIDMDERKNRQKVMQALEEAMQQDRAPYKILQFNDFGLVAITRKRVKQSLERTLCQPCHYCEGAGYVKSVPTVIGEILLEAQKIARAVEDKNIVLRVHPEVAKVLKSHRNQYLEELEATFNRPVLVTGDPTIHIEKFDIA